MLFSTYRTYRTTENPGRRCERQEGEINLQFRSQGRGCSISLEVISWFTDGRWNCGALPVMMSITGPRETHDYGEFNL